MKIQVFNICLGDLSASSIFDCLCKTHVLTKVSSSLLIFTNYSGFFGADNQDTLLCYAIYAQFFQKEPEVPCRNEVDELDTGRGFISIATAVLVLLILTPLP